MTHTDMTDGDEVDLWQIADFLIGHAKIIFLGGIVGVFFGWGGWSALAPFKGELVINVEKLGNAKPSIDYMIWRNLEQNLPLLALQLSESVKVKEETTEIDFKAFSSQKWWQQNVLPTYALTKADTRSLLMVSKELQESEGNTILNIVISDKQRSREAVERRLVQAADFIREGAAYLAIKGLLARYQIEVNGAGDIRERIAQNEVELKYLRERAKRLEFLRAKFPHSRMASSQQVLEIKDSNAKYMPVESQLVAVYADIAGFEERATRLRLELLQLDLKQQFLTAANPLMAEEVNGLQLVRRLLEIEEKGRGKLKSSDQELFLTMEVMRAELLSIRTRFDNGLTKNALTKPIKSGPALPLLGGFLGGAFLMLMWLMLRQGWIKHHAVFASSSRVSGLTSP